MDIAYVTECHTDRARGRYAMTWDGVGMEWLAPRWCWRPTVIKLEGRWRAMISRVACVS